MDPRQLRRAVTPRTRAIQPVHIYGLPVDMGPVLASAREHGLRVDAENSYWGFAVVLGDRVRTDAAAVVQGLAERGVDSRPFFWPMHEQPVLRRMGMFAGESYPVAERIARRGLYLPSGPALTEVQIREVAAKLREVLAEIA